MPNLSTLSDADLIALYQQQTGGGFVPPAPSAGGSPTRITVRPAGARSLSEMSNAELAAAYESFKAQQGPSVPLDILKSLGSGVAQGAAGLAGLPDLAREGMGWVARKAGDMVGLPSPPAGIEQLAPQVFPTTQQAQRVIEGVTGPLHEPQTMAGSFASSIGQGVPAAVAGPAGVVRNLVNFAVVPGIAAEAAGRTAKRFAPQLETAARVAGGVTGGVAASLVNRPSSASRAIRNSMSPDTTADDIQRAGALMDDAAARGVQLTWAEALEQVAPGAGLNNLQRVVESTPQGRETLAPFFGQRPGQIEQAARQSFDTVAPPNYAPSGIGRDVGAAAEGTIRDWKGAINATTRPMYQHATAQRIDPATFATIRTDPVFQEGLRRVRADEWIGPTLQGLPDDSVAVIDAIKKQLDQTGRNLRDPLAGTARNNYSAALVDQGNTRMVAAADRATGSAPGSMGSYETARTVQAQLRERYLQPLLDGPLGQIASKDTKTQAAIAALFPEQPLANSATEITTAVSALARRNQRATRDLIRAHAEATFNEAGQNLVGGANQWGGAKFAAILTGNSQQRRNLQAAIRASGPDGDAVWQGFGRFLDIVEATGKRQAIGSKTSFNTQELKDLATGNFPGNAAKTLTSPGKWWSAIDDAWSRWQLGQNVDRIANVLVDPNSRELLRAIASRPPTSREGQILAGRILMTGYAASPNQKEQKAP